MNYSFVFPLGAGEIQARRASILRLLREMDPGFRALSVKSVNPDTLKAMMDAYDRLFFSGYLRKRYPNLPVTLSLRMTSAAGKFIYPRRQPPAQILMGEIRMSADFLFRLRTGPFNLNGLTAETPQEAFLMVFEHELIHAAEYALYGATSHSSRFLYLAGGLFGHTSIYHQLPTRAQEASEMGIIPGMRVRFLCQDKLLEGRVQRIGKSATVMVPDFLGDYTDSRGRCYSKYRVPLTKLLIVSKN